MNEPTTRTTKAQFKKQGRRSCAIDLKAAYAILVKAYFRNHPDGLELKNEEREQCHE